MNCRLRVVRQVNTRLISGIFKMTREKIECKSWDKYHQDVEKRAEWSQRRGQEETNEGKARENGHNDQELLSAMTRFYMPQFMPNDKI
jgi:hypothetical protein